MKYIFLCVVFTITMALLPSCNKIEDHAEIIQTTTTETTTTKTTTATTKKITTTKATTTEITTTSVTSDTTTVSTNIDELNKLSAIDTVNYQIQAVPYVAWTEINLDKTMYTKQLTLGYAYALTTSSANMVYDLGSALNVIARTSTGYYRIKGDIYIPCEFLSDAIPENVNNPTSQAIYQPAVTTTVTYAYTEAYTYDYSYDYSYDSTYNYNETYYYDDYSNETYNDYDSNNYW